MNDRPGEKEVACPTCDRSTLAVVPRSSEIVASEERADGKVWANCQNCEERFLVYFRTDR